MRFFRFSLITVGLAAAMACHTDIPSAPGVDAKAAAHFDSLVAQATAAGQPKRAAALQIALRSLADGANASALFQVTAGGHTDSAFTMGTITWSTATVRLLASGVDSVTDSLLVQTAWRGINADTIIVTRVGNALALAGPIQPQLTTLGLSTTDSVKAVFVGSTDSAAVADSGTLSASFAILGTPCVYTTVQSTGNDSATQGTCDRVGTFWKFDLHFGPTRFGVASGGSPGIVIIR
jgi:hypothetical protein